MPSVEHPHLLGPFNISAHELCPGNSLCHHFWFSSCCSAWNSLFPQPFQLFLPFCTCSIMLPTCINLMTFLSSPVLRCLLESLIQIILTCMYSSTASCLILQNSNSKLFSPANYQSRRSRLAPLET